jgi:hypothetical protein
VLAWHDAERLPAGFAALQKAAAVNQGVTESDVVPRRQLCRQLGHPVGQIAELAEPADQRIEVSLGLEHPSLQCDPVERVGPWISGKCSAGSVELTELDEDVTQQGVGKTVSTRYLPRDIERLWEPVLRQQRAAENDLNPGSASSCNRLGGRCLGLPRVVERARLMVSRKVCFGQLRPAQGDFAVSLRPPGPEVDRLGCGGGIVGRTIKASGDVGARQTQCTTR